MSSTASRDKFLSIWPGIRDELVAYLEAQKMPEEATEWFKQNLDHNSPGGKLNRGISVVDTVQILKGSDLTDHEYKQAAILGWCIELLQAYFLVADDMMDQSITRRGQPCWYRVEGVGNIAINDAFMLEAAIYHLLKKYFRSEKYYVDLLELFLETTFQTEMGQLIDLITAPEDSVDLSKFSLDKHHLIVVYKTAFYSFYLPVALAMHMSGVTTESSYKKALDILLPMGEYFQVQDDYLDCYGTPEQIGKIGTDILDNKCSWLINAALAKADEGQRKVLDENYGVKSSESEARVKEVYKQLGLAQAFDEYEAESYKRINALIETIPEQGGDGLKREVFRAFLKKVYKRQK
ncbi:BZ3500_MvSof-1268-A1-R1_Chr11-3g03554 [Microbotryum saponariae]|uniref:(2E,6E)-farnesyl diphosphate synthase n=1 Tax=Microbotryum saponariae TaxID=289078 RepID=A0A2X0LW12_9BASI|nr:BZ3500_MvSof-1268-A1-R1_Chr11-3g03554 [Microbotryum saponariae]SDA03563.1 BZ3501_MvSof-1269-A2-R1_Chr11g03131 [Microbotryum saponariae]